MSKILKSSINLEPNDINSEVSLKVSFYNNTEYDYIFKNIVYLSFFNALRKDMGKLYF